MNKLIIIFLSFIAFCSFTNGLGLFESERAEIFRLERPPKYIIINGAVFRIEDESKWQSYREKLYNDFRKEAYRSNILLDRVIDLNLIEEESFTEPEKKKKK